MVVLFLLLLLYIIVCYILLWYTWYSRPAVKVPLAHGGNGTPGERTLPILISVTLYKKVLHVLLDKPVILYYKILRGEVENTVVKIPTEF
jgi:hypothetical protein